MLALLTTAMYGCARRLIHIGHGVVLYTQVVTRRQLIGCSSAPFGVADLAWGCGKHWVLPQCWVLLEACKSGALLTKWQPVT